MLLLLRLIKAGTRRHIAILITALWAVVFLGAWLFSITQHIAFTTGVYWAITTATTVGYGDISPHNASGRLVASLVMLTAIPLLGATFALITGAAAAAGLRRILQMGGNFPSGSYRLVIGSHPTVPAILEELAKAGDPVVLVADIDPARVRQDVHVVRGDPTDAKVLERGRPAGAQHALVAMTNDPDVLVVAVLLRQQAPQLTVSALSNSVSVCEALRALGIGQTVSVDELVAHTLAKSLESPHAGDLLLNLVDSETHRLVETAADGAVVGRHLSDVREEREGLVLGIVHDGKVDLGIADDPTLAEGDALLIAEPLADRHR